MSVRVAGRDDVGVLAGLRRTWNEEHIGGPADAPEFEGAFRAWWDAERPTRTFFLVEVDGAVVGMANVKRYDRMPVAGGANGLRWGYVGNVFVRAEYRNAGIGRVLMDELIAWATEADLDHLRLAPSPESRSFYARLGFVPGAVVELDPPRHQGEARAVRKVPRRGRDGRGS